MVEPGSISGTQAVGTLGRKGHVDPLAVGPPLKDGGWVGPGGGGRLQLSGSQQLVLANRPEPVGGGVIRNVFEQVFVEGPGGYQVWSQRQKIHLLSMGVLYCPSMQEPNEVTKKCISNPVDIEFSTRHHQGYTNFISNQLAIPSEFSTHYRARFPLDI